MSLADAPHRRLNRLTGEWVLVSPQRMQRPWQGEVKPVAASERPQHDPGCYLCPGNERVGGQSNPDYTGAFVFPNDFPALLTEPGGGVRGGLLREEPACGEARVICYAPDHSATLARIDDEARRKVVDGWCDLSRELGARWAHVQIFENKGAMMGASSPHPHGQVWAGDFIPTLVAREDQCQRAHHSENGSVLLGDVIAAEEADDARIVASNAHWLAVVPHWAAWPFETLVIARGEVQRLEQLSETARIALAALLGQLLPAYDALFGTDFPYSMGWHGAPHGAGEDTEHWRLHAHFYPPLLRSAEIRKHMVGYELLAETQRDLTPEAAAERIREVMA
jgi:UDPglucose--hexose-1-phosphate uridylyltransferase